jgi:hypothetical protein
MMGCIPATVVHRNVHENCLGEWGRLELGWSLAPITGICASEHTFACVYDGSHDVNAISVFKRGDSQNHILFNISTSPRSIGVVTRVGTKNLFV